MRKKIFDTFLVLIFTSIAIHGNCIDWDRFADFPEVQHILNNNPEFEKKLCKLLKDIPASEIINNYDYLIEDIKMSNGKIEELLRKFDVFKKRNKLSRFVYGNPLGSYFMVNDDGGSSNQERPSIGVGSNGNFVIVWEDERNEWYDINWKRYSNIYYQRYDVSGNPLSSNFIVNDNVDSTHQDRPTVGVYGNGNFVIVWEDFRNGYYDCDIYAQRYYDNGNQLGSNFKINENNSSGQYGPTIDISANGNSFIAWADERNDLWGDIYCQRYDDSFNPLGSNFMVNDYADSSCQENPTMGIDSSGNFVIAWEDWRNSYNGYYDCDIYAQRYDVSGNPLGSNLRVNDDDGSSGQYEPTVGVDVNGNFVIAWEDWRNDYPGDIYAQHYNVSGNPLGSNFRVNDDDGSSGQYEPTVGVDVNGNFVIAWIDERSNYPDIYAQLYYNNGIPIDSNFIITTCGEYGDQKNPSTAMFNGNIYMTWSDDRIPGNGWDIFANIISAQVSAEDEKYFIPKEYSLSQNYPNPFNTITTIKYQLPISGKIQLDVYNLRGQLVETLVSEHKEAGYYTAQWDASEIVSGVYFYRIQAGDTSTGPGYGFTDVKKCVLIK